ncbi:MAG: tyrosine-type recombinase/integrase [Drouetiella hepatica Uher 2000/2452]|jgi:integrase/recombinase XerD|uniref:Tyrosine-type recombinase/integrase n=1 Tax=Drouetiella hepatica Uher 2000/2452 TaxID=904376 RepID=A0A951QD68_9CYAN|nr:tyrosine-type recombinase/integrase [Drouetiella hepatica Uher 2000/2452]
MLFESDGLPSIRLVASTAPASTHLREPADLRWLRVEEYFQARSLAANTQKAYRRELKRFLVWTDRAWADFTPRQIAQFKAYLQGQKLSKNSINRALTALMSFFDWFRAAYPEQIAHDPTTAVEMERVPLPPARDLSDIEVAALYLALEKRGETEMRDRSLLAVLSHGLRAEEVVNLNVEDFDGVRLTIRQAKDDSTGTVPLDRQAREQLNLYLIHCRATKEDLPSDSPLFLSYGRNRGGQRLGYQGLYYAVKSLGKIAAAQAQSALERQQRIGPGAIETASQDRWGQFSESELKQILTLVNVHPHQLRHTFATGLLLRGVESLHARTLTRHKSEASFKRYAKRSLSAAAERAFYQSIGEEAPE